MIKEIKNTVPYTYIINDLNSEEIIGTFYEKELQNTNQEELRIEKVINDSSFNSWIDEKDLV